MKISYLHLQDDCVDRESELSMGTVAQKGHQGKLEVGSLNTVGSPTTADKAAAEMAVAGTTVDMLQLKRKIKVKQHGRSKFTTEALFFLTCKWQLNFTISVIALGAVRQKHTQTYAKTAYLLIKPLKGV